jgi:glycosyltransferase involved in cell wall biosynthesis
VANNAPWPSVWGGYIRLAQVVEATAAVADLDLFILHDPKQSHIDVPPNVQLSRWTRVPHPRRSHQLRWRLEWALHRGVPLDILMARADRAPGRALREWARPPYDVVWFSTANAFEWMGRPDLGPTVVDLMDLEDVKEALRAELLANRFRKETPGSSARTRVAWRQAKLNSRDWTRFQRSVAAQVELMVVPSALDATRSGFPNVDVVFNTYPPPQVPAGNPSNAGPPVLLFQGNLSYPPNIDGAEWLAAAIAPRIRAAVPATEVRLVGRPGANITRLHQAGVMTVVGQVPSMVPELARASVAVVPIRYGSGTRIKILESFAHRVPVVSTTLGAEGLDVEDNVHLLLADDPEEFAAATVRLLGDPTLRVRLTEAARAYYLERFDGRAADMQVRRILQEVAGRRIRS